MPRRALITAAAPLSIALLCGITPVQGSPEADWTGVQAGLPQYPSLTPNGSHVVWSQGGDLFSASTSGGDAHRLTAHPANELGSAISPDGRLLAFESNRDGTTNLYVMPIAQRDGRLVADGAVRRVTTSDRTQALGGFSHDGRDLLFASTHEPTIYRAPRLYAVSADGDFNGDNIVDVADLGILGANWTASQAVGNTSALVPEPTTLSLLAMSVLMVGHRRRC